jgi:hypothetical protein
MRRFFQTFGALRGMLVIVVVLLVLLGPFAGGEVKPTGISVLMSVVAPAFYVIMLFVLPLDITMSFVFMSDKEAGERARFRFIIKIEFALLLLMVLSWFPLIYGLLKTAL